MNLVSDLHPSDLKASFCKRHDRIPSIGDWDDTYKNFVHESSIDIIEFRFRRLSVVNIMEVWKENYNKSRIIVTREMQELGDKIVDIVEFIAGAQEDQVRNDRLDLVARKTPPGSIKDVMQHVWHFFSISV